jgi:uncharacterized membrane protein
MNPSPRLAVLVVAAAYLCGLVAMLLWIGQAVGLTTLGPLNPRSFLRYGWLRPGGLLLAFFGSRAVPGDTWIGSQFLWLARSFLGLLLAATAGVTCVFLGWMLQVEAFVVVAIALWVVGGLWFLYRWCRGLLYFLQRRPVGL